MVHAVIENGRVSPRGPLPWPDGTELTLLLATEDPESMFDGTPEAIASWLEDSEAIPPLAMSPDERDVMKRVRDEHRAWNRARQDERILDIAERAG